MLVLSRQSIYYTEKARYGVYLDVNGTRDISAVR